MTKSTKSRSRERWNAAEKLRVVMAAAARESRGAGNCSDARVCTRRISPNSGGNRFPVIPVEVDPDSPVATVIFMSEPFEFQRIGAEAARMRRLGMSLRAIGRPLGVDEKTVRKALAQTKDSSGR